MSPNRNFFHIHLVSDSTGETLLTVSRAAAARYENIHAKVSDGYYGWSEFAPFDAIVVTAAAEQIPEPLIEQLAEGGIMIIPIGPEFNVQNLMLVTKKNGEVKIKKLFSVRFVPFTRD